MDALEENTEGHRELSPDVYNQKREMTSCKLLSNW